MEQTTITATASFESGDMAIARNLAIILNLSPGKVYEIEKVELNKYDNRHLSLAKMREEERRFKKLGYRVIQEEQKEEPDFCHVIHYVSQLLFLKEDSEERGIDASYFRKYVVQKI